IFPRFGEADTLKSNRISVLFVAACSLGLAYWGESAYALLEEAYLLTIVGLFVPLMLGLYSTPKNGQAANASMLVGTGIWAVHFVLGWEFFLEPLAPFHQWEVPLSLSATFFALAAYFLLEPPWNMKWSRGSEVQPSIEAAD
ncbi:MAG: hypothetical protein KDA84_19860, partial [Planctomycetaceae bacterium]|nr:hypothetical protein [Planctomycetaceae bacterium]